MKRVVAGMLAFMAVAGCAPMPGPQSAAPPRASAGAPAPVSAAPADSAPTPDARAVLATIPEPLRPEERVAPPRSAVVPDSLHPVDPIAVDSTDAGIPTPQPTRPLGEVRDTSAAAPPVEPSPSAPPPARPAAPDTCWRVQIAAPDTRVRAEQLREAAGSLLMTKVVIEEEQRLYKVRTEGCLSRAAADAVRARARESGFADAFRFVGRRP